MSTSPDSVDEYLASLADDRREALTELRAVIRRNLPDGYEEEIYYGKYVSYVVPLEVLPNTYNKQPLGYAGFASQKQYMSLYLLNVYSDPATEEWFKRAFEASGKKLRMGKSCITFKRLSDLPLDVIGEAIARTPMREFIETYQAARSAGSIGSGDRKAKASEA